MPRLPRPPRIPHGPDLPPDPAHLTDFEDWRKYYARPSARPEVAENVTAGLEFIEKAIAGGQSGFVGRVEDLFPNLAYTKSGHYLGDVSVNVNPNLLSAGAANLGSKRVNIGPRALDAAKYANESAVRPDLALMTPREQLASVLMHEMAHQVQSAKGRPIDWSGLSSLRYSNEIDPIKRAQEYMNLNHEWGPHRLQNLDAVRKFMSGKAPLFAGGAAVGGALALSGGNDEAEAGMRALTNAERRAVAARSIKRIYNELNTGRFDSEFSSGDTTIGELFPDMVPDYAQNIRVYLTDNPKIKTRFLPPETRWVGDREMVIPGRIQVGPGVFQEGSGPEIVGQAIFRELKRNIKSQKGLTPSRFPWLRSTIATAGAAALGTGESFAEGVREGVGVPTSEEAPAYLTLLGLAALGDAGARHVVSRMAGETVRGIGTAVTHPFETGEAILNYIKEDPARAAGAAVGMAASGRPRRPR